MVMKLTKEEAKRLGIGQKVEELTDIEEPRRYTGISAKTGRPAIKPEPQKEIVIKRQASKSLQPYGSERWEGEYRKYKIGERYVHVPVDVETQEIEASPEYRKYLREEEHRALEGHRQRVYEARPDVKALRQQQEKIEELKSTYQTRRAELHKKLEQQRQKRLEKSMSPTELKKLIAQTRNRPSFWSIQPRIKRVKIHKAPIPRPRPIPRSIPRPIRRIVEEPQPQFDINAPNPFFPQPRQKGKKGSFMGLEEFAGI